MLSKPKLELRIGCGTQGSDRLLKRQLLQKKEKKIKAKAKTAISFVQNDFILLL